MIKREEQIKYILNEKVLRGLKRGEAVVNFFWACRVRGAWEALLCCPLGVGGDDRVESSQELEVWGADRQRGAM